MTGSRIDLTRYNDIVVLTGAGISAESGLPTYRGAGGLWTQGDTAEVSKAGIVQTNPSRMWEFFGMLRPKILEAQPNAAHLALAQVQEKLSPTQRLTIITQNIDGLHQRAGSKQVIELHGSLFRTRCANEKCDLPAFEDMQVYEAAPTCPRCSSVLRPDIVLFGEALSAHADHQTRRALRTVDLFISIGTSGTVAPAADFVRSAKYVGAKTILINLDRTDNAAFDQQIIAPAGTAVPQAFGVV
jgi:NAD-dependent deacetylase